MASARKPDWPAVATALGRALPRAMLHPAVLAWAAAAGRGRWAVAFSGGADSLALLLLLWAHWPERRNKLVALHFNHRLRGRASAGDARFCAHVAEALGVDLGVGAWESPPRQPSEGVARTVRHAFFEITLRQLRAKVLWLGHQQDDIAETMLMRLARGSGTAGLAAPRPVQPRPAGRIYLRPLLTLKKERLMIALREAGAVWREDASNSTPVYFRNRLRNEVLPGWKEAAGRDALAAAAAARELLEEDDDALETWATRTGALSEDGVLELAKLTDCPQAVWRRMLHRWLAVHPHRGDLSRAGFDALLARCRSGRSTRFSLGSNGFAVIRRGGLTFEPNPALKEGSPS